VARMARLFVPIDVLPRKLASGTAKLKRGGLSLRRRRADGVG
jgi:hypothetical protein